ncbi:putative DNA repair protein XRCC1 [Hypsibius exemplaris]|uniref:DNA repair protein XRCC1 n=1 Tax=Hypsibius exemplaris TaxID=2072580 RepID=A0A1W0WG60_HYPEX|nr:putative DNA repair protein XRCC1 [Hypsibius exemplaris]
MASDGPLDFTVVEFSSEDAENPATTLLNTEDEDAGWRGAVAGAPQEFVVIQLDKPSFMSSIKVRNNFSGLLEVLGRRSDSKSGKWEAVTAKTSLMTPIDSRGKKNGNVQRDLPLKPEASGHTWDKLKFVCMQPFNKEISYGLTGIEIQAATATSNGTSNKLPAGIVLKKKEKSDVVIEPGSLFASSSATGDVPDKRASKRAKSPGVSSSNGTPPLPQDEDEDDTEVVVASSTRTKPTSPKKDRVAAADRPLRVGKRGKNAQKDDATEDEDDKPSTSRSIGSRKQAAKKASPAKPFPAKSKGRAAKKPVKDESDSEEDEEEEDQEEDDEPKSKKSKKGGKHGSPGKAVKSPKKGRPKRKVDSDSDDEDAPSTSRGKKKNGGVKRKKGDDSSDEDEEDEQQTKAKKKPAPKNGNNANLQQVMEGCILALSGFINPERGQLREKVLEMGGKYRPDWSTECTHLVCAVAGTPKFEQARAAGGRIVRKEWIDDCHANKRMVPWRTYMLRPNVAATDLDADDEAAEEAEDAKNDEEEEWAPDAADSSGGEESEHDDESGSEVLSEELSGSEGSLVEDDEDAELAETDEEDEDLDMDMTPPPSSKKAKPKIPKKRRNKGARFDESDSDSEHSLHLTDSEEADIPDKDFVPRKRPLFRSMAFFLYGDFPEAEKLKLTKTIESLAGTVHDSSDDAITHCVTTAEWCPEFEEAMRENPGLMIVTPKWIVECAEGMNLLDARKYKPTRPEAS